MTGRPIVLAAGGTGGHLFPAQALAAELVRRGRSVVLVTDRRFGNFESQFPGLPVYFIRAGTPSGGGLLRKARALGEIALGTIAARRLLRRLAPAVVIGFGGYPSLPTMLAAAMLRLPTLLHEQNAILGRVNRLLAGRVDIIATSFAGTRGVAAGKARLVGNPVRDAVIGVRGVDYVPPGETGPVRLLVFGGSQGASIFSSVVPAALLSLAPELRARLRVTQQCRAEDLDRVRAQYRAAGVPADTAVFFDDMATQIATCHLAITRAGASTVAELAAIGRPAILVPYAAAMDDHQTANAESLVTARAAVLLPQDRFDAGELAHSLNTLLSAPVLLTRMASAARELGRPGAVAELADIIDCTAPPNGNGASTRSTILRSAVA